MDSKDQSGFAQSEPPNSGLPKIRSIFDFTAEALEEVAVWLEQRGLTTPITQVVGFSKFTAQSGNYITTSSTTVSTTYVDLADATGPTLSGLSDGSYVVWFGGLAATAAAGNRALISISANGATPADADAAESRNTQFTGISRAIKVTLSSGSNSLKVQYRSDSAAVTAFFASRWMIVLRYANA